jgi:trehalose-6-phosphatase
VEAILANALAKAKTQLRLQKKRQRLEIELPKAENSGTCSDNQPDHLGEETSGVINRTDIVICLGDNQPDHLGEETSRDANRTDTVICLETEMKSNVRCSTRGDSSMVSFKHGFLSPLVNFLAQVTSRLKRICRLVFNWHS